MAGKQGHHIWSFSNSSFLFSYGYEKPLCDGRCQYEQSLHIPICRKNGHKLDDGEAVVNYISEKATVHIVREIKIDIYYTILYFSYLTTRATNFAKSLSPCSASIIFNLL